MHPIKRGDKARHEGVILNKEEYQEYKKLLNIVELFKHEKREYDTTYNRTPP